jgi:hypothetical protein
MSRQVDEADPNFPSEKVWYRSSQFPSDEGGQAISGMAKG